MTALPNRTLPRLMLSTHVETWPIAGGFTISRGTKTRAEVITVSLTDGARTGRGECVPYGRYNETLESVQQEIEDAAISFVAGDLDYFTFYSSLKPGSARNAIDCAVWDYLAKSEKTRVWELAGIRAPQPYVTAYTISLGTPVSMAGKVREATGYDLLKIKLGGDGDDERMAAVREAAPHTRLIADANEAWAEDNLESFLSTARNNGFELVEQPLPEGKDSILAKIEHPIPICADESCHDSSNLEIVAQRYDAVNVKLDKTGGFTEALAMVQRAQDLNLKIMLGCMVGTSLAMAPALLLGDYADWIDLDGPLLLAKDREPGLSYSRSLVSPAPVALWG